MKFTQTAFLGLMAVAMTTTTTAFSMAPRSIFRSKCTSVSVARQVSLMGSEETSGAVDDPQSSFDPELDDLLSPTDSDSSAEEASAAPVAEIKHTVYVGNLPFSSTKEDVSSMFSEIDVNVLNIAMPTNPNMIDEATGMAKSKGFCFVDVESEDMIVAAVEAFNDVELEGRTMRVNKLLPKEEIEKTRRDRNYTPDGKKKLYVGNLSFDATQDDIKDYFEEFGQVSDLYVPMRDGQSRGFCFVTMDTENANKAMAELDGANFLGRTLTVNEPLKKGDSLPPRRSRQTQFKLYVGNLSFYTTRETLQGVFEEFGEVYDCYLPTDPNTDQPRGFGFITMDKDNGEAAIAELDGLELEGRFIRVNEAQGKRRDPPSPSYGDDGGFY